MGREIRPILKLLIKYITGGYDDCSVQKFL